MKSKETDRPATASKKGKKKIWPWLLLGAGVLLTGYFIISTIMIRDRYVFRTVCQGEGVPDAASYDGDPGEHPVIVFQDGRLIYHGLQPPSVESTQLVACAGPPNKYLIETCSYSGGSDVKRYGYQQEVQLYIAQSGELIADETVYGSGPRSCSQYEEKSVSSLTGEKANLWGWLERYVDPNDPVPFGETGASGNGIEITILEVNWDAWEQIREIANAFDSYAPAEDEVYVMVTVQIKNTMKESKVAPGIVIDEDDFEIQSGSSFYTAEKIPNLFKLRGSLKTQEQATENIGFKLPRSALEKRCLLHFYKGEAVLALE